MKPSESSRRKRTGSSLSWSFDESGQLVFVGLPAPVIRVVVPSTLDHHELDRSAGGRGDVLSHLHGYEHIGRPVQNQGRAANPGHAADVVEPQAHQECWEDAVMPSRDAA